MEPAPSVATPNVTKIFGLEAAAPFPYSIFIKHGAVACRASAIFHISYTVVPLPGLAASAVVAAVPACVSFACVVVANVNVPLVTPDTAITVPVTLFPPVTKPVIVTDIPTRGAGPVRAEKEYTEFPPVTVTCVSVRELAIHTT
jgi:hypothetical protein